MELFYFSHRANYQSYIVLVVAPDEKTAEQKMADHCRNHPAMPQDWQLTRIAARVGESIYTLSR